MVFLHIRGYSNKHATRVIKSIPPFSFSPGPAISGPKSGAKKLFSSASVLKGPHTDLLWASVKSAVWNLGDELWRLHSTQAMPNVIIMLCVKPRGFFMQGSAGLRGLSSGGSLAARGKAAKHMLEHYSGLG